MQGTLRNRCEIFTNQKAAFDNDMKVMKEDMQLFMDKMHDTKHQLQCEIIELNTKIDAARLAYQQYGNNHNNEMNQDDSYWKAEAIKMKRELEAVNEEGHPSSPTQLKSNITTATPKISNPTMASAVSAYPSTSPNIDNEQKQDIIATHIQKYHSSFCSTPITVVPLEVRIYGLRDHHM